MSNGIGRVWAVNAEGGDEGRPNGVGPVYIENADKLGSKLPEPAAGDAGKVLGVLNSEGDVGWVEDQSGTLTQVQSDWTEDDSSQVSYIQNKPALATVATSGSYADLSNKPTIPTVDQVYDSASANAQSGVAVAGAVSGKQDTISDLETIRSGAALGATAVQPSALATVATSGSYADLSNTPTIPTVSDNVAKLQYGVATYAQVVAAFNAGKAIYLYTGDTDDGAVSTDIAFGDDGGEIIFSRHNAYGSAGSRTEYKVTSSNVWSTTTKNVAVPTVDQSYSASSANAQSGVAVAQAIAAIPAPSVDEVPAVTSTDDGKVLTASYSGGTGSYAWATAQGGGSSYTFSAPLRESSGTVVLDVDTDNLKVAVKTTTLSMQREMSGAANNGYGLYVGDLVTDTSGTVYTFTFDHVPVPSDVSVGVQAQGKKLYPLLVGQTYGNYGNQWIIPTALTLDYEGKVNGSFSVCFKPGEQDYPTSLTSGANLNYVAAVVFVLSDMSGSVPSAQVDPSSIYGSTTSGSSVDYSTGGSMLMVKYPLPASTSADEDKVLTVNSSGVPVWANQGTSGSVNEFFEWSTVTASDIATCLTNGHNPIIRYEFSSSQTVYAYLESVEPSSSGTAYTFFTPVNGTASNGLKTTTRLYIPDWTTKTATRALHVSPPACSSTDSGKVLTVNSNGYAVWDNIPAELPASLGTAGQVLTVNSGATGVEWATPSGGASYTFAAPLHETSGTVSLDIDTDNLKVETKDTPVSAQRSITAAESGYAWYLGTVTQDTSDTVYTFTFNNVPVSNAVSSAVRQQGKHIYPLLVGNTYGTWGNQWIIPTALTFNGSTNTVSGSFDVCFKSGEQDYPTHLDSTGALSWASVLVMVVASDVPSTLVSSSEIYGSTTSDSTISYSTGGSMLMIKYPVPAFDTTTDVGKVLTVTANGLAWVTPS